MELREEPTPQPETPSVDIERLSGAIEAEYKEIQASLDELQKTTVDFEIKSQKDIDEARNKLSEARTLLKQLKDLEILLQQRSIGNAQYFSKFRALVSVEINKLVDEMRKGGGMVSETNRQRLEQLTGIQESLREYLKDGILTTEELGVLHLDQYLTPEEYSQVISVETKLTKTREGILLMEGIINALGPAIDSLDKAEQNESDIRAKNQAAVENIKEDEQRAEREMKELSDFYKIFAFLKAQREKRNALLKSRAGIEELTEVGSELIRIAKIETDTPEKRAGKEVKLIEARIKRDVIIENLLHREYENGDIDHGILLQAKKLKDAYVLHVPEQEWREYVILELEEALVFGDEERVASALAETILGGKIDDYEASCLLGAHSVSKGKLPPFLTMFGKYLSSKFKKQYDQEFVESEVVLKLLNDNFSNAQSLKNSKVEQVIPAIISRAIGSSDAASTLRALGQWGISKGGGFHLSNFIDRLSSDYSETVILQFILDSVSEFVSSTPNFSEDDLFLRLTPLAFWREKQLGDVRVLVDQRVGQLLQEIIDNTSSVEMDLESHRKIELVLKIAKILNFPCPKLPKQLEGTSDEIKSDGKDKTNNLRSAFLDYKWLTREHDVGNSDGVLLYQENDPNLRIHGWRVCNKGIILLENHGLDGPSGRIYYFLNGEKIIALNLDPRFMNFRGWTADYTGNVTVLMRSEANPGNGYYPIYYIYRYRDNGDEISNVEVKEPMTLEGEHVVKTMLKPNGISWLVEDVKTKETKVVGGSIKKLRLPSDDEEQILFDDILSDDKIKPHPYGFLKAEFDRSSQLYRIYLNNKFLLYTGKSGDFQSHPEGVVVREGNIWRLYTREETKSTPKTTEIPIDSTITPDKKVVIWSSEQIMNWWFGDNVSPAEFDAIFIVDAKQGVIKTRTNMSIVGERFDSMPDHLKINGKLVLGSCPNLKRLPSHLRISGSLMVVNKETLEVPDDISVGSNVTLLGCSLAVYNRFLELKQKGRVKGEVTIR